MAQGELVVRLVPPVALVSLVLLELLDFMVREDPLVRMVSL